MLSQQCFAAIQQLECLDLVELRHHGVLQIITVAFYRLANVRLRLMIAPQGYTIGPAGLEPPERARNRRKATVII